LFMFVCFLFLLTMLLVRTSLFPTFTFIHFLLSFTLRRSEKKNGKKDRAKEAKENILISVSTSIFFFRGSDVEVDSRKKGSNLSYVVMSDMF
jgi:hypothetical protein